MKTLLLLAVAMGLCWAPAGVEAQSGVDPLLEEMSAVVSAPTPEDQSKANDLLGVMFSVSNQVQQLKIVAGKVVCSMERTSAELKEKIKEIESTNPDLAEKYQVLRREMLGKAEQAKKTLKKLADLENQTNIRIQQMRAGRSK